MKQPPLPPPQQMPMPMSISMVGTSANGTPIVSSPLVVMNAAAAPVAPAVNGAAAGAIGVGAAAGGAGLGEQLAELPAEELMLQNCFESEAFMKFQYTVSGSEKREAG